MRHLALPFFCAVAVGLLLALLAWALHNQLDAVALACAIGAVFFAWRCWEDLNTTWPAFKAEMQRRPSERQRAPLAADETHGSPAVRYPYVAQATLAGELLAPPTDDFEFACLTTNRLVLLLPLDRFRELLCAKPADPICSSIRPQSLRQISSRLVNINQIDLEPFRENAPGAQQSVRNISIPPQIAFDAVALSWFKIEQMNSSHLGSRESSNNLGHFNFYRTGQVLGERDELACLSGANYGERSGHLAVLPRVRYSLKWHFHYSAHVNGLNGEIVSEQPDKRRCLPLLGSAIDQYRHYTDNQGNHCCETSSNSRYCGPVKPSRRSFTCLHQDAHLKIPLWTRRHSATARDPEVCRA